MAYVYTINFFQHCAVTVFNNTTPIIVQIKKIVNFNKSEPSAVLDLSVTYNNNNLDEKEETRITLNTDNVVYVTVMNVTSSFNMKTYLNLRYIALNGYNMEYKREKKILLMKLRKPQVTAAIRSNGRAFCMGAPTEYEAKIAARRIARIIQKSDNKKVQFCNFKIVNVLGSCVLPFAVKMIPFVEKYKSNIEYEPELNTGLIYRIKDLKTTLIMYSTGSIIINAPSEATLRQAIEHIYPLVLPFGRSKLLDDAHLMTGENQALLKNTGVEESNENY